MNRQTERQMKCKRRIRDIFLISLFRKNIFKVNRNNSEHSILLESDFSTNWNEEGKEAISADQFTWLYKWCTIECENEIEGCVKDISELSSCRDQSNEGKLQEKQEKKDKLTSVKNY